MWKAGDRSWSEYPLKNRVNDLKQDVLKIPAQLLCISAIFLSNLYGIANPSHGAKLDRLFLDIFTNLIDRNILDCICSNE